MFYEEMKKTENSDVMWEFWSDYRGVLTDFIFENIESFNIKKELADNKKLRLSKSSLKESILSGMDKKPTLAIWGAGGCNDIDIERLSKYFQLVLVDCEEDRVNAAIKKNNVSEDCRYIDLKFWDISDEEYHLFEAMLCDGVDVESIGEYLMEITEEMISYNCEAFSGFDYSVIVGLASQLNARFMALFDMYCDESNFGNAPAKRIYSEKEKNYIASVVNKMNKKAVKIMFDMAFKLTNKLIIFGYEALSCDVRNADYLDDECKSLNDEWEEKSHVNETLEWMINNNTEIMGSRELEAEIVDVIDADKEACLFDFKSTIWDFSPLKKYLMMLVSIEKQGV